MISGVKFAKADSVKMFVEMVLILARVKEHVCALQTLVNANVKRKLTLTDPVAKIKRLLQSGRLIDGSDFSVNIAKLKGEVHQLTGLIESKDLKLQTVSEIVEDVNGLREKRSVFKRENDQLSFLNKAVLALGTEIFELRQRLVPSWDSCKK